MSVVYTENVCGIIYTGIVELSYGFMEYVWIKKIKGYRILEEKGHKNEKCRLFKSRWCWIY